MRSAIVPNLVVTCKCGQKMRVPAGAPGKSGVCVACDKRMKIAEKSTELIADKNPARKRSGVERITQELGQDIQQPTGPASPKLSMRKRLRSFNPL